jgi:phosphatidylglycerophosphatase A
LGIGNIPFAPGTFGSIAAFLVYLALPKVWFADISNQIHFFISVLILSMASVYFVSKAESKLGHDHKSIVIDEFFGYFITVSLLPKSMLVGIIGLVLFRIFDIFKPEPVDWIQRFPKGWGIMLDDLVAGVYGNIGLQLIMRILIILSVITK